MYIEVNRSKHQVAKMAQWLNVSRSGYYLWRKRHPSMRDMENQRLLEEILRIHEEYQHVYGSHKMTEELNNRWEKPINRMSRKGNCWDNAPMESFWGKLKQEWLNEQHFKIREEGRAAVFEYIWIFYNRKRIHESNGYQTPESYYQAHSKPMKAA